MKFLSLLFLSQLYCGNSAEQLTVAHLESGLGLIIPTGIIKVKKTDINSEIGLLYPTNITTSAFYTVLDKIERKMKEIEELPIMKLPKHVTTYKMDFETMKSNIEYIRKIVQDVGSYTDKNRVKEPNHHCQLIYESIKPADLEVLLEEITHFTSKFPKTSPTADENDFEFISNFAHLRDSIDSTRTEYMDFITEINALAAHQIPSTLPFFLETLECIESGELEELRVNYCMKSKYGLYCELSLNAHKSFQYYTRYSPISYDGTTWEAENENQILLKSAASNWEILECTAEDDDYYDQDPLADFLECKTKPFENLCMKNIETNNTEAILAHCNFTSQNEIPAIIRTELGVLVSDQNAKIKELNPSDKNVKFILQQKAPVHIITSDLLFVSLNNKDIYLRPTKEGSERKITYTKFSEDFVTRMQKKAQNKEMLNEYLEDYLIDTIFGIILVIIVPITLILCGEKFKNYNCKNVLSRQEQEPEELRNYRQNRQRLNKNVNNAIPIRIVEEILLPQII